MLTLFQACNDAECPCYHTEAEKDSAREQYRDVWLARWATRGSKNQSTAPAGDESDDMPSLEASEVLPLFPLL